MSNFINLKNSDRKENIYRIMKFNDLVRMLETGKNGLSSPLNWRGYINGDKHENCILNSVFEDIYGNNIEIGFKDDFYCQSWSRHNISDAMWQLYSCKSEDLHDQNKNLILNNVSVRVRTTVDRLYKSLAKFCSIATNDKCFVGRVKYVPDSKLKTTAQKLLEVDTALTARHFAETLFYKRNHFKHEDEVRLVFHSTKEDKRNILEIRKNLKFYNYDFDYKDIIDQIMFDPRLSNKESTYVKTKLAEYLGKSNIIVKQSLMYREPKFLIKTNLS